MHLYFFKHHKSESQCLNQHQKPVILHEESYARLPEKMKEHFERMPFSGAATIPTHVVEVADDDSLFFAAINTLEHDHFTEADLFDSKAIADSNTDTGNTYSGDSPDTFGGGDTGGGGAGSDF